MGNFNMPRKTLFIKYIVGMIFFSFVSTVSAMNLIVKPNKTAIFNGKVYQCAIGKNGMTANKKEGDLKTPEGKFPLRYIFFRPDIFPKGVLTGLLQKPLSPNLGWCDDLNSIYYNQLISLPFPHSHENLWRSDNLYDVFVIVGYNDDPIRKRKGSAIFIHTARPGYAPTAGCIAFSRNDLLEILKNLNQQSYVIIG